ncbi:patellin-3-like [Quillaja saponaria]|uniref:Patellin-3-like n=1 Tax=Quillaja saponaria TaxID=32244 RepID=A0AAD7PJK2_QUISA|nr:patellin-3-like [Quillaja saponaria]
MAEPVSNVEQVVVTDVPQAEKEAPVSVPVPVPETEAEKPLKPVEEETVETEVSSEPVGGDIHDEKMPQSGSFKEESNKVSDLPDAEKKALEELKLLIQEALNKHEFSTPLTPPSPPKEEKAAPLAADKEVEKKETTVEGKGSEAEAEAEAEPAAVVDVTPTEPVEPIKPEAEVVAETEDSVKTEKEATVAEATPTVVVTEVVEEKAASDSPDDDGAKTVEAIEETIVAVSSSVPVEQPSPVKESGDTADLPTEAETKEAKDGALTPPPPEEVSVWGIPLLADERSDVILLKFLRARDFKVKDAFTMIKNTIRWRKEFGIDELLEQDLGNELEKVVFMHGSDKEGHPVCYNVYGEFQNKELYQKTFSDEEKRLKFLKWRIQFLEKSIRKLDFTPGGICTIVQVNDLKNSPGLGKSELRQATKQALQLLQDNYPEFVAKQVFINVPWWYLAVNRMISPFLTQRTKSKFLFAGPSKSAETLLRYIAAEQLQVKYGGLSKEGEFGNTDAVTEITVRPASKHTVEFPATETCLLTWEVRVLGWDVNFGAEFVPNSGESYTVIIQKSRKVAFSEEPVISNTFKIGEPGKVVLTIDNSSSKKKRLLYRLKTKLSSD